MYRCGNAGMSTMAIANHFGIGEGTVYNCLARVVLALLRVWKDHVYWPRGHEYATNRSSISEGSNGLFKGCVGFLDGTDVVLAYKPTENGEAYWGRKRHYGLNLQAVCDQKKRFTYVACQYTCACADSMAFKATKLYQRPGNYLMDDDYLLADKAYELTSRCITPYKSPLADQREGGYRTFNRELASMRIKIEHAFGMLKARLPILRQLPVKIAGPEDHMRAVRYICGCIVIHNFCQRQEGDWEGYNDIHDVNQAIESQTAVGSRDDRDLGRERRDALRQVVAQRV
jgi:hypothetical protein